MGIRRNPWRFLENILNFKISYGLPYFHPTSEEAPIPDRRCLFVAHDAMCQLHRSKCRGRPIDLFYSFMGPILALLVHNRFVEEYNVFFDIQKYMSPLKFEEQKARSERQKERPYKDMSESSFVIKDNSATIDGTAESVDIRRMLSERHLRPLLYRYFVRKAAEAMKDVPGPTLVIHFDETAPWVLTSQGSIQDPKRLIPAGEGEIAAVRCLMKHKETPCWLITDDSDALYLSLRHALDFAFSLFYSGSGGRYINATKNVRTIGVLRIHHICQYFILSGTDFVKHLFPKNTRSKTIWNTLNGSTFNITDLLTFKRVMTLVYREKLKLKPGKPIPGFPDEAALSALHKRVTDNAGYWDKLQE